MSEIQDRVQLRPSWKNKIGVEFEQVYMQQLRQFLLSEKQAGKVIYPEGNDIFNSMNFLSYDDVKVVIIGQDPYHGPMQAHGLCFSVKPGGEISAITSEYFQRNPTGLRDSHQPSWIFEKLGRAGCVAA